MGFHHHREKAILEADLRDAQRRVARDVPMGLYEHYKGRRYVLRLRVAHDRQPRHKALSA